MTEKTLHGESHVLVTGGTGLIGGELLKAIARRGSRRLWALVRERPRRNAGERLAQRLGGWTAFSGTFSAVEVVRGDVAEPALGIEQAARREIRRDVEIILHCASETSFIRNQTVRRTNIYGIDHLLSFARSCRREPLIVYVSSACQVGAARPGVVPEEGSTPAADHHNEYTWSKAEAERRLLASGLPVLILRPSIVISAALDDRCFARSILWFLPLLRLFDALPIDPDSRIDIVPVSFVVEAALRILGKPRRHGCYHLSAGEAAAATCRTVAQFLDDYYRRPAPLRLIRPQEWCPRDHRRYIDTPLRRGVFGRMRYYLPFLNMDVVFDDRRLREEVDRETLPVPSFLRYLGEVLDLVTEEESLLESQNP
ncbi:MAG: SDR family oxidoreductase [Planctomycetes bacterium]|nr:SDR family oxidoreductase [Planctomycetota bacterium]